MLSSLFFHGSRPRFPLVSETLAKPSSRSPHFQFDYRNRHLAIKMGTNKGKKTKVADEWEEDGVELIQYVEKLQEIQDELEKINEEASDKVLEVEQKYNEVRRPVYQKRNNVIQTIPDFWLTAFLSHPVLGDLLTDEDQKIFKHLVSLDVQDFKDVKSGYSITFNFSENPFFEETKLTKTFSFLDDGTTNITCTPIKWKEGMEIANGDDPQKEGSKRPFSEESFFTWISGSQDVGLSETIHDEVAEVIKDDLWPNPLKYFNNEADDFEGEDDDEEKESGDGVEEDEEDSEQEDEDEE